MPYLYTNPFILQRLTLRLPKLLGQAGNEFESKLRHLNQKNLLLIFYYAYIIFYKNILCIQVTDETF